MKNLLKSSKLIQQNDKFRDRIQHCLTAQMRNSPVVRNFQDFFLKLAQLLLNLQHLIFVCCHVIITLIINPREKSRSIHFNQHYYDIVIAKYIGRCHILLAK